MSRLSERSKSVADWLVRSGQVAGVDDAILERRAVGVEKYGIELVTFNGRRPLLDAYQEALDLIVYLAQEDMEHGRRNPSNRTLTAIWLARELRRSVEVEDAAE
jgi:hypothetical protein